METYSQKKMTSTRESENPLNKYIQGDKTMRHCFMGVK